LYSRKKHSTLGDTKNRFGYGKKREGIELVGIHVAIYIMLLGGNDSIPIYHMSII
jgi:hypothetical protein